MQTLERRVFERPDSLIIRIAERFGLTQMYGVAGTYPRNGANRIDIPNYIYSWPESEIEKYFNTISPSFKHNLFYKYGTRYPKGSDLSSSKK